MTIWFTADTHFGEQPRARQRAAGLSADGLDELIARRWRETGTSAMPATGAGWPIYLA